MFASDKEFKIAQEYTKSHAFPGFTKEQVKAILGEGRKLHKWYKEHTLLHNCISAAVILFAIGFELSTLLLLPKPFLHFGLLQGTASIITSSLIVGLINGIAIISIGVYSIHEGAAHDAIAQNNGPVSGLIRFMGNNMCRLHFADPEYYSANHLSHHANFATQKDATFTNFVTPDKFLWCLVPMAFILNMNPYRIHTGQKYTRSRIVSESVAVLYRLALLSIMIPQFGWLFSLLTVLFVGPTVSFLIDRLRESTEHNLMPLTTFDGTRQLGIGFWGLLIGGGPWGQPCHMSHHFYASLPWYAQLKLHAKIRALMTAEQRKYFLVEGPTAFPLLVFKVVRESIRLSRDKRRPGRAKRLSKVPFPRTAIE